MAVGQLECSAFVLFRILFYRFSLGCSIRFTCLSSPTDERFGVILQSLFQFRLFGKLRDELVKEWVRDFTYSPAQNRVYQITE